MFTQSDIVETQPIKSGLGFLRRLVTFPEYSIECRCLRLKKHFRPGGSFQGKRLKLITLFEWWAETATQAWQGDHKIRPEFKADEGDRWFRLVSIT